jgi:D-sedoheptulose 7-phosphate isomerase
MDAGAHLQELTAALHDLSLQAPRLTTWGRTLAGVFRDGGRLLVAGNGGSAAEAQHLTAELVGRFGPERPPLSAIALHAETSSLTAIANDYGEHEMYARQVEAHGRPGDVLLLLSTSGASRNVLEAARRGKACGLAVWGLTGCLPNPLAALCDETLAVSSPSTAVVQEVHLVASHLLCESIEMSLGVPAKGRRVTRRGVA